MLECCICGTGQLEWLLRPLHTFNVVHSRSKLADVMQFAVSIAAIQHSAALQPDRF